VHAVQRVPTHLQLLAEEKLPQAVPEGAHLQGEGGQQGDQEAEAHEHEACEGDTGEGAGGRAGAAVSRSV
jgi:hypothetical protein